MPSFAVRAAMMKLAPRAQREAVHRRDHRQAQRFYEIEHTLAARRKRQPGGRVHVRHRLDVGSRHERAIAGAGQDRAAYAGVARQLGKRGVQPVQRVGVERVARVGPVDRDRRDRAVARDEDVGRHRVCPAPATTGNCPDAVAGATG
jgi:hypothetical protein